MRLIRSSPYITRKRLIESVESGKNSPPPYNTLWPGIGGYGSTTCRKRSIRLEGSWSFSTWCTKTHSQGFAIIKCQWAYLIGPWDWKKDLITNVGKDGYWKPIMTSFIAVHVWLLALAFPCPTASDWEKSFSATGRKQTWTYMTWSLISISI